VILSGTATDGTLGLVAIKADGRITFAQDESARDNSMPRTAIAVAAWISFSRRRTLRAPYVAARKQEIVLSQAKSRSEARPRARF
jgi:hypothetical protein